MPSLDKQDNPYLPMLKMILDSMPNQALVDMTLLLQAEIQSRFTTGKMKIIATDEKVE